MATKGDILIAEDDDVLRGVYVKKFTLAGYGIRTADNGDQAIAEVEKKEPDVILLDINMPVSDGFTVLEKYPREKRQFPIIALTNFGDEHTRSRAESLGVDDYFIKSEMTIRKLLQMVEALLKAKSYWNKGKKG